MALCSESARVEAWCVFSLFLSLGRDGGEKKISSPKGKKAQSTKSFFVSTKGHTFMDPGFWSETRTATLTKSLFFLVESAGGQAMVPYQAKGCRGCGYALFFFLGEAGQLVAVR